METKQELTIEQINKSFKEFMDCKTVAKQKQYLKKYLKQIEK